MKDISQLIAILRRLAAADGDVSVEETRWLRMLLTELPSAEADEEFDPERLKQLVESKEDAEELLRLMLLVSMADGQTSLDEWDIIQETAQLVGFPQDELETMRSETVLAAEPFG